MRRVLLAVFVVASTVALAGCDGAIKPQSWATTVCQSLTPWRETITTLNKNAQSEMATAKTPQDTRTHLLALLSGAQQATEKARADVAAAGVPDVDGGAVIERRFIASLVAVRDAYAKAATTISALSTADADAFYAGVAGTMTTLNTDYANSGVNTDQLASPELQADFDKVTACR